MITAEDTVTLVQAIKDNAQRLGLVWMMRLASVTVASPIALRFDGDADDVDNDIVNLTGESLVAGDRVYVMSVPPAGNYIMARSVSDPNLFTGQYQDAAVATPGVGVAVAGGAEVAIPSANWANEQTFEFMTGYVYGLRVKYMMGTNTAGVLLALGRIRQGAATVVGTILAEWRYTAPPGVAGQGIQDEKYIYVKNTSSRLVQTKLSLTNQAAIGGTAFFFGSTTPNYQISITAQNLGRVEDHPFLTTLATTSVT